MKSEVTVGMCPLTCNRLGDQVGMGEHDPFGIARGTRGVDQLGDIIGEEAARTFAGSTF